jgi:hypothetical protein
MGRGIKLKPNREEDQIYYKGQNKRREHQKNLCGNETESVLCETSLDALDENQDAAKH